MSDEARRAFGALLVDYGGVMTTSISASFAAFCVESGVDPQGGPPPAFSRPRLGRMFDAVVRSDEVGLRKPDPEIYLLTSDRLEVSPQDCVFVDDLPANVEGARAVGMAGVLHKHPEVTIPKLEELLGIALG